MLVVLHFGNATMMVRPSESYLLVVDIIRKGVTELPNYAIQL